MCRWLAYLGAPLRIEELLFQPQNSLIRQSLQARLGATTTNGDGFGLGWYGERGFPGVYRDILPAWHDANLRSLSEQIRARLFLAHVRASTGTSTSRENCHPFRFDNALFMHNGQIGGYARIRREIETLIPHDAYGHRHGTTDSEAFFLLAIGNGLQEEPAAALARTIRQIEAVMAAHGIAEPFYAEGSEVAIRQQQVEMLPGRGSILVLSEPLDMHEGPWREVPPGHVLESRGGVARVSALPVT